MVRHRQQGRVCVLPEVGDRMNVPVRPKVLRRYMDAVAWTVACTGAALALYWHSPTWLCAGVLASIVLFVAPDLTGLT